MNKTIEALETEYSAHFAIPEPGQLVEVRRRHWVVSDVNGSMLAKRGSEVQHLVTMTSLDEDSPGEELQVIWQLEPGARVFEKAGLPKITGWDSAERLEAFLDAVRWGAVTKADATSLQAPFRSGITIEDYQLEPLVRAIDMARVNLLIADDVGLGKTIEAGLVIQEMLLRHRARTVLIVCPASLQLKWQAEMLDKFGLEFRIVDTDYVKKLRRESGIHANPWTSFPRLISSMDWMKSGEALRHLKDALPPYSTFPRKFDILVVDEAHNIAPAAATQYAVESQRTRLVRMLSPHFAHRLFLTATPHNGYQESFTSLLELLDDQRFAKTVMPDEKQLNRVMVRRLKSDIVDAEGKPIFPIRRLECLEVDYSEEEREIHRLLGEFTRSRALSVTGTRYAYGSDFIHRLLKKRLFSSPMAFATTLEKHRESVHSGFSRKEKPEMDDRILRKAIAKSQEEYSDENLMQEAEDEAISVAGELAVPFTPVQLDMLNRLAKWAENAKHRVDAKAIAILTWLENHLRSKGEWNDKRVIMFTEYRATLSWLQQILSAHGYGGDRLMIMHGSLDKDDREKVKAAFQAHPDESTVRILLATDAASEGIDLQNHCNYMIHVEIPWNPNVMEQRNGRIDRHGQRESAVYIWHPVGKGFDFHNATGGAKVGDLVGDQEYLMRAVFKIDQIRQDLGSVGPVIARQIEETMLGRRVSLDTRDAEIKAAKARRFVTEEKRLQERMARIHERLIQSKADFHLYPEHIFGAVEIALDLAGMPALKPLSWPGVSEGTVFEMPVLPGSWGKATEGLEHPYTGVRRPITFDNDVAKGRDDLVLVHLNHRLVQICLRLLREELWSLEDVKRLHRVAVFSVADHELTDLAVIVWSRLVITGGDHRCLHEELTLSGGELRDKTFVRIPQIGRLESLLEKSKNIEPGTRLFDLLRERFECHEDSIRSTVEVRSRDRNKYLTNTINRRKKAEIKDLLTILEDLGNNIKKELDQQAPQMTQLQLWPEEQRAQLKRDVEALKGRLARIPEERKKETAVVESRYATITDRTFPVAVIFIVPKSMAKGR